MRRLVLSIVLIGALCPLTLAQELVTITSDTKNPARPLSTLLNQLRKRERVPVTYEDPRYGRRSDMEGKPLSFVYSRDEIQCPDGLEAVIARMLREYGAAGGVTFRVKKDGSRHHVVPSEVLNSGGAGVRQNSILETTISLPAARRDGGEFLQAICDEIKKQSGYDVGVGPSAPDNNLAQYTTTEGITNKTAREALQYLLDRATPPSTFVWDLYFDPADGGYGLNFAYVGPAAGPVPTAK